jgi:hypothetical protein
MFNLKPKGTTMQRNHARRTQRGFFAIGIALAIVAGFSAAGWGVIELTEGDTQAVAAPGERPATISAQAVGEARAD